MVRVSGLTMGIEDEHIKRWNSMYTVHYTHMYTTCVYLCDRTHACVCAVDPPTFSRFMLLSVASIDFTTPVIDLVTWTDQNKFSQSGRYFSRFFVARICPEFCGHHFVVCFLHH